MVSDEELVVLNCGVGQDPLESLDCKEIQTVSPQGNQSWIFIGRTNAEIEPPILWQMDVKNWLIRKGPVTGKDWRQEEKRMTEDEMVGWHHWLDGHEFAQAPGVHENSKPSKVTIVYKKLRVFENSERNNLQNLKKYPPSKG